MNQRKGIEAALGVVIAIVVLIIVAVSVTTIVIKNTSKTGAQTETQISVSGCQLAVSSWCAGKASGTNVNPLPAACGGTAQTCP